MLCGSGENGFVPRLGNRAENVKPQVEGWQGAAFLAPDYCFHNEPFAGASGSIGPETSLPCRLSGLQSTPNLATKLP